MSQECVKCGRRRPNGIVDPSCSTGGYCTWVTLDMHSDWIVYQKTGGYCEQIGAEDLFTDDLGMDDIEDYGKIPSRKQSILSRYSTQMVVRYPFAFNLSHGRMNGVILILQEHPDIEFRGEALLLWGVTAETRIHSLRSGSTEALCINPNPVPAILYDCPGEVGETLDKVRLGKFTPNFYQWVDMQTAGPAKRITLEISGPVAHAVLMGKGLSK